eukprot:Blabericola_migrator_1__3461@NODE_2021_length_3404_cov_112_009290_g1284_i0_p2_GENE_NODE_2021_length_3404_cov_112_009290_g1284_i0NODE_2021_length_3404_cov_112_009290_g1284_i0_p2_ORF_typecomplete_len508_score54_24_NODE_2021_length_3404_cov_112_009290_g1284_i017673290
MEPEVDLHYLAEASPRDHTPADLGPVPLLERSASPQGVVSGSFSAWKTLKLSKDADLTAFIDTTVRAMGYRAFLRWFHGPFSASQSLVRIIGYYVLALFGAFMMTMSFCHHAEARFRAAYKAFTRSAILTAPGLAVYSTSVGDTYVRHQDKVIVYVSLGLIAYTLLAFLFTPQTLRVAFASTNISILFAVALLGELMILILRHRTLSLGPFPPPASCSSDWTTGQGLISLIVFTSIQALLATVAICMTLFIVPLARWYIWKSERFVRGWYVEIMDIKAQRNQVTIRACPFGCGNPSGCLKWRKNMKVAWQTFRTRRRVYFSPTQAFLPVGMATSPVKPCCAFCCIYIGNVDDKARPHGYGYWQQGWGERNGEYLNGCWEFGRPVAPFSSRQNVCGSGFTALRFGWVKFDFVTPTSMAHIYKNKPCADYNETLTSSNFEFGLLDVECSVFGNFFRKFPKFVYWKVPSFKEGTVQKGGRIVPSPLLHNRQISFSYLEQEAKSRHRSRRM